MADADPDDIPHEHRATLSNIVTGRAKEVLGRALHREDLVREGETQEQVAHDDVEPDLDDDVDDADDDAPA
jgi:hypothetical protein